MYREKFAESLLVRSKRMILSGPKVWRSKKFERSSTNFQRQHVRLLRERYIHFTATVNVRGSLLQWFRQQSFPDVFDVQAERLHRGGKLNGRLGKLATAKSDP